MGCLGNVLWFVFGGAVSGLSWRSEEHTSELVSGRLSLVYYRCGDSGGDAVF